MASSYPFFAGAALVGAPFAGKVADLVCGAVSGPLEPISALMVNKKVCTAVFRSSCLDSLISTFWKYPERFSAVIKFATELMEAAAP